MSSYIGRVHTSSTTVAYLDSTSTKLLANTFRFYKTQDGHPVWHQRRHRDRSVVDHRHSQYSVKIRADHSIPPHTHTRARASARALTVMMPGVTKERLQFTMPPRASVVTSNSETETDTCCSHVDIRPHSRSLDLEHKRPAEHSSTS